MRFECQGIGRVKSVRVFRKETVRYLEQARFMVEFVIQVEIIVIGIVCVGE